MYLSTDHNIRWAKIGRGYPNFVSKGKPLKIVYDALVLLSHSCRRPRPLRLPLLFTFCCCLSHFSCSLYLLDFLLFHVCSQQLSSVAPGPGRKMSGVLVLLCDFNGNSTVSWFLCLKSYRVPLTRSISIHNLYHQFNQFFIDIINAHLQVKQMLYNVHWKVRSPPSPPLPPRNPRCHINYNNASNCRENEMKVVVSNNYLSRK